MNKNDSLYQKFELINKNAEKGAIIKTSQLKKLKLYYKDITALVENGYLEKIKYGYYRVSDDADYVPSEQKILSQLFPDAIVCMYSALFYYGYSDHVALEWNIAVDRNTSKAKFNLEYPLVRPYYMEQKNLQYGVAQAKYYDCTMKIFDRDRLICEVIRNENKMDREIYCKSIKAYVNDPKRNIGHLIDYARKRNMYKKVEMRIGIWL